MLSKPLAFEQDKTAIFLRNQEMHLHFSKLDSIRHRKNTYLPQIPSSKHKKLNKNMSSPSIFRDKEYFIQRDNNLIYKKLDKICKRPNQINNDSEIIDGYLNVKKCTREKFRELKRGLLVKENIQIKNRLYNTRSVIDNKQLNEEFKKSKKISGYLRKIHPSDSVGNIYLNSKESKIIRLYEKEKMDHYLKEKEKERKEKEEALTGRKNFSSSVGDTRIRNYLKNIGGNKNEKSNKKEYIPFNIDKKILGKIRYV